jgi:hypothetical protein
MDQPRSAVDRVRPVLQAMERSIDAARRRRLDIGAVAAEPPSPILPIERERTFGDHPPLARLKARPKRAIPRAYRDEGEIRSAG